MRPLQLTTRLLCSALVLLVTVADALQPSDDNDAEAASRVQHQILIFKVIELTNHERTKAGLQPLVLQKNLAESAGWLAQDMATKNYLNHQDTLGRALSGRVAHFGYEKWTSLGENIAGGQPSPEQVVKDWLSSTSHRRNMLNPTFTEIGVGFARASKGDLTTYWVQDFGTRRN